MLYVVTRHEEWYAENFYDCGADAWQNSAYICGIYISFEEAKARLLTLVDEIEEQKGKADFKEINKEHTRADLSWYDVNISDEKETYTYLVCAYNVDEDCDCPV